jgi:mannose-6-phosphate isomerase
VRPLKLPGNQLQRFYRGGARIRAFRGLPGDDDDAPEEWIGSTTTLFGSETLGLSRLPDGRSLRDAIRADPEAYLGPGHAARFGPDPGLLVKLLDAGERLPVHFHPDRAFAWQHLGSRWGKTEAWIIVGGGGTVHVGFREELDGATVAGWVERQEAQPMLDALHAISVEPGDTIYVPAGTPHAIGEGILMVELQEPSDLSVLLEWEGFAIDGAAEGHLGLGFEVALDALDRSAWSGERLERIRAGRGRADPRSGTEPLFPVDADAFFGAERIRGDGRSRLPAAFSIVIVLDGDGELVAGDGSRLDLARGEAILVPFAAGDCHVEGSVELIRCLPPAG